ncbi:uncharacterized protein EDB91DRAFT_1178285 [Suillus paluster]|uniref:uncharacterized protein n=1 Tax=Suillus paluster TaxID=48578 RepID=UPI001B8752F9|nr:uncharacterized protein EDB91DRAFT_1178285 [Suillus paluster]KAG1720269.1 hypothetical protein EDB91DRAFT_1178285 [Suillus paluster]
MSKKDVDLPDWSKLTSAVISRASHALTEAKQLSNQVMSQQDADPPNWSKLSDTIRSRASNALTEVKQLAQDVSQKDIDLQNINWSKASGDVLSRASDALTEAKRLVNEAVSQKDLDLSNVDWSKVSGNINSRASDALTEAKKLVKQASIYCNWSSAMTIMSRQCQEKLRPFIKMIYDLDWPKLRGAILSSAFYALTAANNWSIRHPYVAAGALLCTSASADHEVLLTSLQLTGITALYVYFLPARPIIWLLGFGSLGVKQGT